MLLLLLLLLALVFLSEWDGHEMYNPFQKGKPPFFSFSLIFVCAAVIVAGRFLKWGRMNSEISIENTIRTKPSVVEICIAHFVIN